MQNTQEAQKDITTQGAAFNTDCRAGGQADIQFNYYYLYQLSPPPTSTSNTSLNCLINLPLPFFCNQIMRESRIEKQLEQVRQLSWVQVIECTPKGIERDDVWILWVPGRKATLWEGGLYPVTITFPPQYPKKNPSIEFQPEFLHIHVYEGGSICLPLIDSQNWRQKTTMTDILQRIISLIHQDINQYSPANVSLYRIIKQNPQRYQLLLKQQAHRYQQQSQKYFNQPCIHINVVL